MMLKISYNFENFGCISITNLVSKNATLMYSNLKQCFIETMEKILKHD